MGPLLAEALREHQRLARPNDSGLVFCDAAGKPHDAGDLARRVLSPLLNNLGLPNAGWRAFRRLIATALDELHEPVRTAQQILGHSSPTTTLAFDTQTKEKSQRDALSKLEELLCRGRDAGYPTPPAQIRTCSIPSCGSYRRCLASKRRLGYG